MPTYYDSQNQAHFLSERIGSGGEGTVFSCADSQLVAKIYHEPITEEKAEKLRWMAANKTDRLLKTAAWVSDVLTDAPGGTIVGFLMPNIKAKEIHELYSLKSRRVYFPEATWHFLVHTAANVARAFYNLHGAGHIMGDINQGNCVVAADGTVKLIDCDSYSVSTGERRYTCEVGVTTHIAPELQGANLRDAERLPQHDNFGLAVIIFQLLFLGRHPFAGNVLGEQDKSLEDCIREHRFAYGTGAKAKGIEQPPGTLHLSAASPRVAALFERAFWTEHRPEPREWIEALEDLSQNLEQCALHPGHLYFNGLPACPCCDIEAQTGLMVFPFVTSGAHLDGKRAFNIFTVENLIASLGIEHSLAAAPPKLPIVLPPPTDDVVEIKRASQKQMFISIGAQFFVLIFLMLAFNAGTAIFFGVCMVIFWVIFSDKNVKISRGEIEEKLSVEQTEWEQYENDWKQNALPPTVADDLSQIKRRISDYQNFQQTNLRQAKFLRGEAVNKYLRTARFADADIPRIRDEQRRTLIENGFETAAQMEAARLGKIDGIGKRTVAKLLAWRKSVEEDYDAAADENNLKEAQAKLALEATGERRRIEREIETLLVSLRAASVGVRRRQQQFYEKTATLAASLSQTKSNIEHLGTNAPTIIILIIITILTPYFGFVIGQINAPRATNVAGRGSDYSGVPNAPPPMGKGIGGTTSVNAYNVPDEDITDAEIKALPDYLRSQYAETLYAQAVESNYRQNDYQQAEQSARFALRFKKDDTRLLNQLGFALCEQGRHTASLAELYRSLEIDEKNNGTRVFIGINYIKQERFVDARRIFTKVTASDSTSLEGFYNLGLAHVGLNDYAAATEDFNRALSIKPTDADSHYNLAVCLDKTGYEEEARREYDTLLKLDARLAEKLKDEIHLATQ